MYANLIFREKRFSSVEHPSKCTEFHKYNTHSNFTLCCIRVPIDCLVCTGSRILQDFGISQSFPRVMGYCLFSNQCLYTHTLLANCSTVSTAFRAEHMEQNGSIQCQSTVVEAAIAPLHQGASRTNVNQVHDCVPKRVVYINRFELAILLPISTSFSR